jgi:photosystem II stability/assembly factor-like uncharacterized protein
MKKIVLLLSFCLFYFISSTQITHAQWVECNNGLNTDADVNVNLLSLAVSGNKIFAGSDNSVYLSTDNGDNWTKKSSGLANNSVRSLAISGNNIFAGTESDGIYLSTNNGGSWTKKSSGLTDNSVRSLAVSGNDIFAATLDGVFVSTNNGDSWMAVNNG